MTLRAVQLCLVGSSLLAMPAGAQEPDGRAAAPIDLEGYWVSLVTEDWRWRMVTPKKGDYASVPLNQEGIRLADSWAPDEERVSCLAYGAAGIMRMPTRLRITWVDANTLRIETDHGMQTRELTFGENPAPATPSRQGRSTASWDGSALKVETSQLLPGYLRRNGVPYSSATTVTEYYNTHSAYGDDGFTITTIVHDPLYLTEDFVTSTTFVKLDDGSGWTPTTCAAGD